MYLPVDEFEPMSSVFLGECVTHQTTVADHANNDKKKAKVWLLHY